MLAPAHIILHVGFCRAIARVADTTSIAVRVRLIDRIGKPEFDRVFRIERGDEPEGILEFDSGFGVYRLALDAPAYGCAATQYLFLIAGHDRSISVGLADAPGATSRPALLSGTAPQSFLYVQPTFVLFDKAAVACNKPVPQPRNSDITVENDQDAYYAWFYSDQSAAATPGSEQLALRLRTPTHQYHYVRIPIPFPVPWSGWPASIEFNVTEDMIDGLAGDPVDTLLCPKLWETRAG